MAGKLGFPEDPGEDQGEAEEEETEGVGACPRVGVASSLEGDEAVDLLAMRAMCVLEVVYKSVRPMIERRPPTKSMRLITALVLRPAARAWLMGK